MNILKEIFKLNKTQEISGASWCTITVTAEETTPSMQDMCSGDG